MAFTLRWLLILFAFILSGGQILAASNTKAERAYTTAVAMFQNGIWNRAEVEFEQFRQKFPDSTNAPQAVLLEAQSEFNQGKFTAAIALLHDNLSRAGTLANQYVYWRGEAQFQNGDFADATETFESLAKNFPDSSLRLRAVIEAAAARAKMNDWPGLIILLQATNGVFQRAAQMDSGNELVSRGRLLLAQAKFMQNDFAGTADVLALLNSQTLSPELDWQRAYLLCQAKMAAGDLPAALAVTTNLLQISKLQQNSALTAQGVALRAGLLEQLGRPDDAITEYQKNLTNAPTEQQRQAILKIAELAAGQNEFTNAEQSLSGFLLQFSNAPAVDTARLTLGELYLKDFSARTAATNQLPAAQACFDQFLGSFTNSPLVGKAFLDRGWCEWLAGDTTNSLADFQAAAQRLPTSEDLAVARFKTGDAQFALTNYAGALENYRAVLNDFTNFPVVAQTLGDRALYQSLRANLELNDLAGASNDLAHILKQFPNSILAPNSALLYGESLAGTTNEPAARAVFQKFETAFPDSSLRPQVEFAIARTYELEQDWTNAMAGYKTWLDDFPTNDWRPRASFARARADYENGNEAGAFVLFTNFTTEFPTNEELTPLAQWWIADYFFRTGTNYVDAEKNYELVYQNFPASDLAYRAQLMAGRSAAARQGYSEAIRDYFSKLETDTNCPPDLRAQAMFAHGLALMRAEPVNTNNPAMNFQLATNEFGQMNLLSPTNEASALASFYIGECDVQMASYDAATNAYAQVFVPNSPANISLRSRAQIGFGIALEKKSDQATGDDQTALRKLALNNYLDVFETAFGKNLRDGEAADAFWVKKAGLQALPLIQSLGVAPPDNFINQMENLLPQLKDSLDKLRVSLPPQKS